MAVEMNSMAAQLGPNVESADVVRVVDEIISFKFWV